MLNRTIEKRVLSAIFEFEKMVLLSGPRQVGKTTLAKRLLEQSKQGLYFNWDVITDQKRLALDPYFFESSDRDSRKPFLVILDEIHKYARWKSYLKGAYDKYSPEFAFLITGSGRLDIFKRGGDSLLGRYLPFQLFPLSVSELNKGDLKVQSFITHLKDPNGSDATVRESYETLLRLTGFPEPFARGSDEFYRAWSPERKSLLVKEDIRDASAIRDISLLEMLSHLIPTKVGSKLSINSLREDLGVAFETIRDWISLLEQFYFLFRVLPYTGSMARTLRKESKVYLYDWGELDSDAARFENLVALHLLKATRTWSTTGQGDFELRYLRDKEKREVDFVITLKKTPLCLIECKTNDTDPAPSLIYYQRQLKVEHAVQVVNTPGICRKIRNEGLTLWVISADRWLNGLGV